MSIPENGASNNKSGVPFRRWLLITFFLVSTLISNFISAQDLSLMSYQVDYKARLGGLNASATKSLSLVAENEYELKSSIQINLLGRSISKREEASQFTWTGSQLIPGHYQLKQSGLGSKKESIDFDSSAGSARAEEDGDEIILSIDESVFDKLNYFIKIRQDIENGKQDIRFNLLDADRIKQQHFHLVKEEVIDTPLGKLNAVKLERIREAGKKRKTELWLASDWDFILIKLYQNDGDGIEMELNIENAVVNHQTVTPL